ncbi:MAG: hypothetical protein KAI73_02210 [Rhodospirillaceae bacterium]|nr:hypothetical protein [Rhodospirillaceae bacterium]
MSVNAAGSAVNVQQAMIALRQAVSQEQVAAAAVMEAANQATRDTASAQTSEDAANPEGRGEKVDVKA